MCGIAGFTGRGARDAALVLKTLEHRGPDDYGFLTLSKSGVHLGRDSAAIDPDADVVLLHRRLSILDLTETGWQPMGYSDGRYYIIFNGEIYNYLELRAELRANGHQFRSTSDTEVLLAAYAQWGTDALTHLVGMFALAILDTQERKLFLARDFYGIKPLYYTVGRNGFAFASEIKALLDVDGVSRRVNPERLYFYLRYGLTSHGEETLFSDIHQLPAGHFLEVALDYPEHPQPVSYWNLDLSHYSALTFDEAAAHLRELFLKNVRLHMRSDVPVGAALSGGIDSASIVMAMRHLEGKSLDLHTFSYIADDPVLSEERWVDLVGRQAGAVIHKIRPTGAEMVDQLDNLIYQQDEPFASTSIFAQYSVFRVARQVGIKVMLDGQGADEMLGGYLPFLAARLASLVRQGRWDEASRFLRHAARVPGAGVSWLLPRMADFLVPPGLQAPLRRLVGKEVAPPWLDAKWFSERGVAPAILNYTRNPQVLREHQGQTLMQTSLPHLLRYEDRNSMAHSIESRVPFLTPELVTFVLSLPEEYIVAPDGTSKAVFRKAMRGIVPDAILDRKDKIGFVTPERTWLATLRPWVERTLQSAVVTQIPALRPSEVKREWDGLLAGHRALSPHLWRCLNLFVWAERFNVSFS